LGEQTCRIDWVKMVLLTTKLATYLDLFTLSQNAFHLSGTQAFDHATHALSGTTAVKTRTGFTH
jgi:hypothetical protein